MNAFRIFFSYLLLLFIFDCVKRTEHCFQWKCARNLYKCNKLIIIIIIKNSGNYIRGCFWSQVAMRLQTLERSQFTHTSDSGCEIDSCEDCIAFYFTASS